MSTYYNEFDPKAAAWLRELISCGHIPAGEVDERSILDVLPGDLKGFTQIHFFAGIGGWAHALRLAGWPDDRPVWTGSCPCQPFSAAGQGIGFDDERHLWPSFFYLIEKRRPPVVFGEQVASKDGLAWLDLVHADLEGTGYAVGAVDTCAAGFGAPHIRQRLYFVAQSVGAGIRNHARPIGNETGQAVAGRRTGLRQGHGASVRSGNSAGGAAIGVADSASEQRGARRLSTTRDQSETISRPTRPRSTDNLADSTRRRLRTNGSAQRKPGHSDQRGANVMGNTVISRLEGHTGNGDERSQPGRQRENTHRHASAPGATNGFWADAEWIPCRDSKARPVEPGTFPLVNGASARVGRLRGYGNAIVPQVAAAFIEAYLNS